MYNLNVQFWQSSKPSYKTTFLPSPFTFHLSLKRWDRWGTTDDLTTKLTNFSLHCPLGLGELQACSFPNVVFPPLFQSAF